MAPDNLPRGRGAFGRPHAGLLGRARSAVLAHGEPGEQVLIAFDGGRAAGKQLGVPVRNWKPLIVLTTLALWAFRRDGSEALTRVPIGQIAGCDVTSDGVRLVTLDGRELRLYTGAIGAGGLRADVLQALAAARSTMAPPPVPAAPLRGAASPPPSPPAPGEAAPPGSAATRPGEPGLPPLELPGAG